MSARKRGCARTQRVGKLSTDTAPSRNNLSDLRLRSALASAHHSAWPSRSAHVCNYSGLPEDVCDIRWPALLRVHEADRGRRRLLFEAGAAVRSHGPVIREA